MGLFCCGKSSVEPDKPDPETFFFKKRGCTDIFCLIIFIVFWAILGWLTSLSITYGEPWAIVYGSDYLGNRCGRGSMSDKSKVYYPRVDEDLKDQALIASSTPWKLRFYGLCVKECPSVSEPTACFSDPDSCKVDDYGTEAEYTAAGGRAYYYATMPSQDVLNRCVPKDSASLNQDDDRCAFPQCDNVTNPWMVCDETYPTTWKMTYPDSLKCEVKFRVGTVQQLRTMTSDTLSRSLGQYAQPMPEATVATRVHAYLLTCLAVRASHAGTWGAWPRWPSRSPTRRTRSSSSGSRCRSCSASYGSFCSSSLPRVR